MAIIDPLTREIQKKKKLPTWLSDLKKLNKKKSYTSIEVAEFTKKSRRNVTEVLEYLITCEYERVNNRVTTTYRAVDLQKIGQRYSEGRFWRSETIESAKAQKKASE